MDADRVQEGHLDLKTNIQTRAESQNWTNWRRHRRSSELLRLQGAFTPPSPASFLPREHGTSHRRIVKDENSHWKHPWSRQWETKEKEDHRLHLQNPPVQWRRQSVTSVMLEMVTTCCRMQAKPANRDLLPAWKPSQIDWNMFCWTKSVLGPILEQSPIFSSLEKFLWLSYF